MAAIVAVAFRGQYDGGVRVPTLPTQSHNSASGAWIQATL